jgi:hypothetical protein
VQQLLLSENEKYLAAIGEKGIQIVELSQRARLEMHAKSNQDVTCTTFKVAEYFFLNHPTARIVKAAWHPISSQHMVVLTTDNIIRLVKNGFPSFSAWLLTQTCALFSMYNVSVNMEEPEQIFRIPTMLEVLVKETSAEKRTPGINKTAKAFLTYSPSVIDGSLKLELVSATFCSFVDTSAYFCSVFFFFSLIRIRRGKCGYLRFWSISTS